MGKRRLNPRLAKVHRNYSVEQIARLFGLHKNTVRNWLKEGLTAIDDRRPTLILGRELLRFLLDRRQKAKQVCGPGRIFCIACRAPKVPAGRMAECLLKGPNTGNLCGICPDCDRLIYRRVNPTKIDVVGGDLEITVTRAPPRIVQSCAPSLFNVGLMSIRAYSNFPETVTPVDYLMSCSIALGITKRRTTKYPFK
jgi:hypothetical protein